MVVGNTRCGFTIAANASRRGSGTGTTPVLGSMVQNGKLAASMPALVNALKALIYLRWKTNNAAFKTHMLTFLDYWLTSHTHQRGLVVLPYGSTLLN